MNKKTKIVCTIGPASWDPEIMRKMIENGMNCARVNGAFADPAEMDKVKNLVRAISEEVSLMLDVKGPEVRMNKFPEPIKIAPGMPILIGSSPSSPIYPANYPMLYQFVKPGQIILVGDGDVELVVKDVVNMTMHCEVVFGEILKPGKALNLPGCIYTTDVLTEKDKENLRHAIVTGWDFVSPSFIQDKESALQVREFVKGSDMKIIAKIENQVGIDNIDQILEVVDGIMVARGGLGVELGLSKVPMIQKLLIEKANNAGKPVITATQMLESMTTNPSPTRAEANDVATAILSGTDAVMLSGESSAGKYPAEAVAFMTQTAIEVESSIQPKIMMSRALDASISADAITKAAASLCIEMIKDIDKVIVVSKSGRTARLLTRHNVAQPVYAFVSTDLFARTLMLSKGIVKVFIQEPTEDTRDHAIQGIIDRAKTEGIVSVNDRILLICKTPIDGEHYFPNIFEVLEIK
ncbi:pyruvate kinase [bacterium]|nr:pyruvate kinase [bacterium]